MVHSESGVAHYGGEVKPDSNGTPYLLPAPNARKWWSRGRPFTTDQWWALLSWFFLGTSFWMVLGTTSLISFMLWGANRLPIREYMEEQLKEHLSYHLGATIHFESAIVPNWKGRMIQMENVKIDRSVEEAAVWNAATLDLTVDTVNVKLSLLHFLQGKGIVEECSVRGIRGVMDRRVIDWDAVGEPERRTPQYGDFDLKLTIDDALVTIHQSNPDRPLPLSINNLTCSRLRKQWLLFDLLSADNISGSFDSCLFSVSTPQRLMPGMVASSDTKVNSIQIDGLNIDMLSSYYLTGPISWITKGNFDLNIHYTLPIIMEATSDPWGEYDELKSTPQCRPSQVQVIGVKGQQGQLERVQGQLVDESGISVLQGDEEDGDDGEQEKRDASSIDTWMDDEAVYVIDDPIITARLQMTFKNLNASVPLSDPEVSYLNTALVQPLVAYLNTNYVSIPIESELLIPLSNFDGSWYPGEAGLWDMLSEAVYNELVRDIEEQKKVSNLRDLVLLLIEGAWRALKFMVKYKIM